MNFLHRIHQLTKLMNFWGVFNEQRLHLNPLCLICSFRQLQSVQVKDHINKDWQGVGGKGWKLATAISWSSLCGQRVLSVQQHFETGTGMTFCPHCLISWSQWPVFWGWRHYTMGISVVLSLWYRLSVHSRHEILILCIFASKKRTFTRISMQKNIYFYNVS